MTLTHVEEACAHDRFACLVNLVSLPLIHEQKTRFLLSGDAEGKQFLHEIARTKI